MGFAAETENIVENAEAKRAQKGLRLDPRQRRLARARQFGGDGNTIHLVSAGGVEDWPPLSKRDVAERLAPRIAAFLDRKAAE